MTENEMTEAALKFAAEHNVSFGVPSRHRENLYVAGVRVDGKNASFDYHGEGVSRFHALRDALLEASEKWHSDFSSNPLLESSKGKRKKK